MFPYIPLIPKSALAYIQAVETAEARLRLVCVTYGVPFERAVGLARHDALTTLASYPDCIDGIRYHLERFGILPPR